MSALLSYDRQRQDLVRSYIRRWGMHVVDGGCPSLTLDDGDDTPVSSILSPVDIYLAGFAPDGAKEYGAIDVPRRSIYWPRGGCDPYFLLHEFAHLLTALLTGQPVSVQDEDGLLAAVELYSVRWMASTPGSRVSVAGWRKWRESTGDADGEVTERLAAARRDELVEAMLFYSTPDVSTVLSPTFWLPDGDVDVRYTEVDSE